MIVAENGSVVGRLRIGEGVIVKEQHRPFSYCEGRVLYPDYNVVAQTYLCYNV